MAPGPPQGKRGDTLAATPPRVSPSRPTPRQKLPSRTTPGGPYAPLTRDPGADPQSKGRTSQGPQTRDPHRGTRETPTNLPPRSFLNTWETCILALACHSTVQPRGAQRRIGPRLYPGAATRETAESNHLANKNTNMPLQTKRGKQNTRAGTEPTPPLLTQ